MQKRNRKSIDKKKRYVHQVIYSNHPFLGGTDLTPTSNREIRLKLKFSQNKA
jgi:hypothetical protein